MGTLGEGLAEAFWMLATLDGELVEITLRSLQVTLTLSLIHI